MEVALMEIKCRARGQMEDDRGGLGLKMAWDGAPNFRTSVDWCDEKRSTAVQWGSSFLADKAANGVPNLVRWAYPEGAEPSNARWSIP
ncbi:hypothetical protein N7481_008063 [Penicillium waksmanii]|uniref:uncharacterized protein n=1 Tax=Penicillium waksmanii TaxID=69791 RepID=UPI002548490F|nr:uncharacterized protein N7481_008063 [Penicillium waksmanii]KAJ5980765.1 hypothetical protein N7481_008063 [Penicillium waksmanii]